MVLDRRTWCKELMNVEIDLKQRDMSNFAGYGCPSFDEYQKKNAAVHVSGKLTDHIS